MSTNSTVYRIGPKLLDGIDYPNLELSSPLSYINRSNIKCSIKNNFIPLCNSGLCGHGTTMILIFRVALQKCLPFQDMQSQVSIRSSLYFAILYRTCRYRFRNWVGFQTRAYFSDYNPSLNILKLTWITFYGKNIIRCLFFKFSLKMVVDQQAQVDNHS